MSGVLVGGKAGPRKLSDGNDNELRLDYTSALVVTDGHARYQEAVQRGSVYVMTTLIAGVTIAAANVFSATNPQPLVGIYNPSTNTKSAVIWLARALWNSGTPAAGGLVYAVSRGSVSLTAVTGTNAAINPLTFGVTSSMIQYVNAAMTGIVMTLLESMGGPTVGALAANSNQTYVDEVAGRIIVRPGNSFGIFAGAAGTSPIINSSLHYEEVDYVAS